MVEGWKGQGTAGVASGYAVPRSLRALEPRRSKIKGKAQTKDGE